jgi:large subunit ribosomal protein L6
MKAGDMVMFQVGYSHPVAFEPPAGVSLTVEGNNRIVVSGADKEMVGEAAARIRRIRPPEPYKGKGIKYAEEVIRRKAGKAGGKGKK